MKNHKRREHGQVIFILAVGIISLLGFTALAIDGARLFSERRTAQGVADTAAFTAAAYIGQYQTPYIQDNWINEKDGDSDYNDGVEPHAEQAALERIRSNGYTDASYNPFGGNDRLRITINPVFTGPVTEYLVEVIMISEIEPIFAQLIYHGDLLVNVESHAIVMPPTDIAFGNALYSLDDSNDCKAIKIQGNSDTYIVGSGIHSNSTCSDSAIDISGSAIIDYRALFQQWVGLKMEARALIPAAVKLKARPLYRSQMSLSQIASLTAGEVVDDHAGTVTFFPGEYNKKVIITSSKQQPNFLAGFVLL